MRRIAAFLTDTAMCTMMYVLQRRHRLPLNARALAEQYVSDHARYPRSDYFALNGHAEIPPDSTDACAWTSPIACKFPENTRCRVLLFPCAAGWKAPTVIMLHALMSASDRGYRAWAREFTARGWNAAFVHLPYHYSRTPPRHVKGELAITADLVRTAQGLRAGVLEIRQLMAWLRAQGSREFGLWACSYGGWIGALLASIERDFRWITLLEPIVDLSDALWRSGAGRGMRRHLVLGGIPPELVARFHPFICPTHATPADSTGATLIAGGLYDRIARPEEIRHLHQRWTGSTLIMEPQGHFGFRLMRSAWRWLEERELLKYSA
jgi:pimeloyl-ACP methyl ester carboxylesterase